jgi:hypothetical protein
MSSFESPDNAESSSPFGALSAIPGFNFLSEGASAVIGGVSSMTDAAASLFHGLFDGGGGGPAPTPSPQADGGGAPPINNCFPGGYDKNGNPLPGPCE